MKPVEMGWNEWSSLTAEQKTELWVRPSLEYYSPFRRMWFIREDFLRALLIEQRPIACACAHRMASLHRVDKESEEAEPTFYLICGLNRGSPRGSQDIRSCKFRGACKLPADFIWNYAGEEW